MQLTLKGIAYRRRNPSFPRHYYAVLLGLLSISAVSCVQYRRVTRKISSSPEPLDGTLTDDLRRVLTLLDRQGMAPQNSEHSTSTENALLSEHTKVIPPELMRTHTSTTSTTTTPSPPSRITTRRFYRRLLRRKLTTTTVQTTTLPPSTTTSTTPLTTSSTTTFRSIQNDGAESGRALPVSSNAAEIFQQLKLINGIIDALNSTASPAPVPYIAPSENENEASSFDTNFNANNGGTDSTVPDILAILSGAKSMVAEASSKSETVVPPPPDPSAQPESTSVGQQVDDPATALALLNLFSNANANANKDSNTNDNSQNKGSSESDSTAALLNLVAQSQPQQPQPQASLSESEATAALTKLLLQGAASSAGAGQPVQGNSLLQPQTQQLPQTNADATAQLTNLLGLLGSIGGAAGQQPQANNINNLFNLGGDQVAQAQTTNQLATLFGQPQQQNPGQNLLSLLGGNQGNQGFNLASLLGGQNGNQNAIPGLGLMSTVSSLGSALVGTVSSLFGGGRDGKPRVRGKGVDTRVGLGYRIGNIGDAQVVWDIGPQLYTEPLRNEVRSSYSKKRESGSPAPSVASYFQPASQTEAEKEVQQIEAKRRMVQAAIQDHYRHDHFASVYPKPSNRRSSSSPYDYYSHYYSNNYSPQSSSSHKYSYGSAKAKGKSLSSSSSSKSSSSSFFSFLPFADHLKGFWTGFTSSVFGQDNDDSGGSSAASNYYNFDDIRSDFSANLIKRSSPDFTEYESRAFHPRRLDDDVIDDPTHSTLTEYERMLLQYGKDIGVANTQHGVIEEDQETQEPDESESNIFQRWFKNPLSSLQNSFTSFQSKVTSQSPSGTPEWDSMASGSSEYTARVPAPQPQPHQKSVKKTFHQPSNPTAPISMTQFDNNDGSTNFNRRKQPINHNRRVQRPQRRKSHNPFRNFITSLKTSTGLGVQRPRVPHQPGGFGRRHFKRPSGGNPKLQHFTNTNKDLMMADANDDFVESAGRESVPGLEVDDSYVQPLSYKYSNEFPDVSLTNTPRKRMRPLATSSSSGYSGSTGSFSSTKSRASPYRATLTQREKVIEPALLYDHLMVEEESMNSEADESFHNRNKVVVNAKLREIEKKKVLGTASPIKSATMVTKVTKIVSPSPTTLNNLQKIQRMRINKLRANMANQTRQGFTGKRKIIVKVKGISSNNKKELSTSETKNEAATESTTLMPSILTTISSIFKGTSKPKKVIGDLIQNASSLLPAIGTIRIFPRKKKQKDDKTRLTMMNGKPTIVGPPDDDEEEDEEAASSEPVVQVGHDMDFSELQKLFGPKNETKRRRFRIRVKDSSRKKESAKEKKNENERMDSDEEDEDEVKDIFVDIESGEVSVLKPVASLVSFAPKKEEEKSDEEEVDYYEDGDGDGIADMDMEKKEHIFAAIQKELKKTFDKMKKKQMKEEQKRKRKQELKEKGMDESIDTVTKFFDVLHPKEKNDDYEDDRPFIKIKNPGGLSSDDDDDKKKKRNAT